MVRVNPTSTTIKTKPLAKSYMNNDSYQSHCQNKGKQLELVSKNNRKSATWISLSFEKNTVFFKK